MAASRFFSCTVIFALILASTPLKASADPEAVASPSPAPQLPPTYVQVQEEISPDYTGDSGSSTQLNFSGQMLVPGNRYLLRLKLPVVTSAPAESVTGAGDLSLTSLRFFDTEATHYFAGLTARIPTSQNSSLGSGKYSLGPAFGYQYQSGRWRVGFYTQNYFSIMGPSSRAAVGKSKIEPIVDLSLPYGWSVGFSTMSITYDWVLNKLIEVPIGGRITKAFGHFSRFGPIGNLLPLQATLEAEQNLSRAVDTPGWTTRISLRWIL
jgi:hypothetical protein